MSKDKERRALELENPRGGQTKGGNSNSSPSSPTFTSPQDGPTEEAAQTKTPRAPPTEAPEEECSLFVGDLSRLVTEEMLRAAFSRYGEVVNVDIKRDKITRNTLGYGFIQFKKRSEAEKAFCLDGTEIGSRKIRIGWAQKNTNLFLGDLDDEVTTDMLQEIFKTYGPIVFEETYVKKNKYGFVKFKYRAHAEKAKQELDGKPLHDVHGKLIGMGRPVRIGWGDANTQRNCVHVQIEFDNSQAVSLSEDDFREAFKVFGKVIKVSLPRYADKRLKGYGFVHFEDNENGERSAARAITTLSGKDIKAGVRIQCNFGKRQVASSDLPSRFQGNPQHGPIWQTQHGRSDIMQLLSDPVYFAGLQKLMSQQQPGPMMNNPGMMNPLGHLGHLNNSLNNLNLNNAYAGQLSMNWITGLAAYQSNLLNLQQLQLLATAQTQAAQATNQNDASSPSGKAPPPMMGGNPVNGPHGAGRYQNWLYQNTSGAPDRNDSRGYGPPQMGRPPANQYPPTNVPYGESYYPDKPYDNRYGSHPHGPPMKPYPRSAYLDFISKGGDQRGGGGPPPGQRAGHGDRDRRVYFRY